MPRYAAIDIGSNSVRLEAAEVMPGAPLRVLASDREVTRLGESVYRTGSISREAADLTRSVLARMATLYKSLNVDGVRAVATSSVRDARNQAEFLGLASEAAATPVEVISGREEARLVQLGVQERWPQPRGRVLIVDIGGGSAELIASQDGHMVDAVSKPLGAVRLWEIFLASDPPAPTELRQMDAYITEKLDGVSRRLGASGWRRAIATSATAEAVASVVGGVPRANRDLADRLRVPAPKVRALLRTLSSLDLAGRRRIRGIGPRRAEIIVPGVAVLARVLGAFGLRALYYSAAGVRDGIIADLAARGVGKERAQLSLDQAKEVVRLSRRYAVPVRHARKVAELARDLFHAFQQLHQCPMEYGKLIEAAAWLHDVGHFVSDASHHKHSYYVVANSDLPGFTAREREFIANLCRYHRKSLPASHHDGLKLLNQQDEQALLRLVPLLRLADGLDRSHRQFVRSVECQVKDAVVAVRPASTENIDLEIWAARRTGDVFRQVYGRSLTVLRDSG
jgi:exopolyphosphatase / guanosine-5'-triphosphate,3'-diphosphate pyrophosphatase